MSCGDRWDGGKWGKVKDLGNAVSGEGDKGILFYEIIRERPLVKEHLVKT